MRIVFYLTFFLIFTSCLQGQNSSVIIGLDKNTSDITHIFKFIVIDSSDLWTISNARIIFKKDGQTIFDIQTNKNGIALAYFVTNKRNYNSFFGGRLSIRAQKYQAKSMNLEQIDYLNKGESIILFNTETSEYVVEHEVDFNQLTNYIINNHYGINEGQGPVGAKTFYEFYEVRLKLKKIPIEIKMD